jgi:hypothetical protein
MMLDDYIEHSLAQIDDLAELKVSLVALRLLGQSQSETASITAHELGLHPALRAGLGFAPQVSLDAALARAVMRGTLLRTSTQSQTEPRYFLNNGASRRIVDAIELAEARLTHNTAIVQDNATGRTLSAAIREIEWLESIEAYPIDPVDQELIEEWLAQGYARDEILQAVRKVLSTPRPKGTPYRSLKSCAAQLTSQPPELPSQYYQTVVNHSVAVPDEILAFHELAHRWPTGHEFNLVRAAAGIYGSNAAIQVMKRILSSPNADVDALLPLLDEKEEAELALAREQTLPDVLVRELIQLYETTFGLLPTSRIAQDIGAMSKEIPDLQVWRGVFQYAAAQNKRDWAYVRKLLINPSPTLFEPEPVNETARFAFNEYKRRVSRGVLDASVAREINQVAQQVTDPVQWTQAIDKAAAANALNWNYIKKVLSGPEPGNASERKDGRQKQNSGVRQRGVSLRPQVEESTEAERETAREFARKRIAERAKRRATGDKPDPKPGK